MPERHHRCQPLPRKVFPEYRAANPATDEVSHCRRPARTFPGSKSFSNAIRELTRVSGSRRCSATIAYAGNPIFRLRFGANVDPSLEQTWILPAGSQTWKINHMSGSPTASSYRGVRVTGRPSDLPKRSRGKPSTCADGLV